ncbi:MAG: hypothetical protein AB9869_01990 [Verrucomicrobiia bacterium]
MMTALSSNNTIHLTIRSLKPGFTGAIERTSDPSQPNSWQEVGRSEGNDFLFAWSEAIGISPAIYRFKPP